jgi:serine/threonine protein kinase
MSEKLERYEILEEIGQGGFAIVYRAQDLELDRPVALKELRPTLLHDTEWVKRFKREARTIARLDHSRIVTIHDVVEVTRRLFIVMRLVDGSSLDELVVTEGHLAWSRVLEIITAVAEALDYAHSHSILHRDLKPANILLDSQRGPLLSDFGLAKLVSEASTSVTAGGAIVGTPHYIAPEVWERQDTTPQSDIYALGCILYEMLTGEKYFQGETPPAVMMAHFNPLTLPANWPAGVPSGVGEVLKRVLAKQPDERYASAGELAEALAQAEVSLSRSRAELQLHLLGPPRVELEGLPLEIKRRKALALLIYLAVSGEPQPRDRLATLLWPESTQQNARKALRRDLSELNLALGGVWLDVDRESVGLRAGFGLDVTQFQQYLADEADDPHSLIAATDLYRDDFLTGFTLPDCPEFDEWQFFQSESLRQTLASALKKLVDTLSGQADYEAAIHYARRWLALDPLHEPAHRQLMQLYAQAGQQAAALRQYDLCRQTLAVELGISPAEATTALYNDIRTGKFATDASITPAPPPPPPPPPPTP